jgi:hypothetical protein
MTARQHGVGIVPTLLSSFSIRTHLRQVDCASYIAPCQLPNVLWSSGDGPPSLVPRATTVRRCGGPGAGLLVEMGLVSPCKLQQKMCQKGLCPVATALCCCLYTTSKGTLRWTDRDVTPNGSPQVVLASILRQRVSKILYRCAYGCFSSGAIRGYLAVAPVGAVLLLLALARSADARVS